MSHYYRFLVIVLLLSLPIPAKAQVSSSVDSDIGVRNTTTNDNLNLSNNENDIGINNFTIDGDRIIYDNDTVIDNRDINASDQNYDGRVIQDNRVFNLDEPNNRSNSSSQGSSSPRALGTNAPVIYAPPLSQFGLGGGISCPGTTIHSASYTRGASGYAQEFGALFSVSIPVDGGLRARCEAAHQSHLANEDAQRKLTLQQANYYREQANKLRTENRVLEMKIRELERKTGNSNSP